jgi:uncharacterized protein (TIGR03382 family)
VPVPGAWRVAAPEGCLGGEFRVVGALEDDAGTRSPESVLSFDTPRRPAALEPLPAEARLELSCSQGAKATLRQELPPQACQEVAVSWEQLDGPALTFSSRTGPEVTLTTESQEVETLAGQSVRLRVTADGGKGNVATREHILPIALAPFVRLSYQSEVPQASGSEQVGLAARLDSTLECEARGLELRLKLEGLRYVEGSARLDGAPVQAEWVNGVLTLREVALEAKGTRTLTWVARPALLEERRVFGEVLLHGVKVSLPGSEGPSVPVSGCGCTEAGPGVALWGLGALAALLRRRRATGRS